MLRQTSQTKRRISTARAVAQLMMMTEQGTFLVGPLRFRNLGQTGDGVAVRSGGTCEPSRTFSTPPAHGQHASLSHRKDP
jgi:hypothetical protein